MREIFSLFYAARKRDFFWIFILIFISSAIEIFSFSMLIPVIYLINDTAFIRENAACHFIYTRLHFTGDSPFIFFLLACMVLLFIIKNQFLLFAAYRLNKFSYRVALDIVERQLARFYKTEYLDVKSRNSVEYLRSIVEAPQIFADFLMLPMIYILNESLVVLLITTGLLLYSPLVVLILLLMILPFGYMLLSLAKARLNTISKRKGILEQETYLETKEGIGAYPDIKLSDKEDVFMNRITDKFIRLFDINVQRNVYLLVPRRLIEVLVVLVIFILFGLSSFLFKLSNKEMVLLLITFATAAYRLLPSLNEIFTHIVNIRTWEFTLDLLNVIKVPAVGISETKYPRLAFRDKIEFRDVCFKYKEQDKTVLRNLNLSIRKGEVLILSGESGRGKSTIAKLMAGFIKPDAGKILVDGKELIHLDQVKNILAYVTQDFYLMDKTILENIAIGEEKVHMDLDKISRIIASVNLSEFISSLPLGMEQPVGEMGAKMSGGERQRLALARALYRNAEMLILDEATGSLDKENEQSVLDTIYKVAKKENITVLMITHRSQLVDQYDSKYELIGGRLEKRS